MGPPIFHGTLGTLASTTSGQVTFLGIVLTLNGIVVVATAGRVKEAEISTSEARAGVAEFNLPRGRRLFRNHVGTLRTGLDAGQPIRYLTLAAATDPLSQGLPALCVVLAGGFMMNFFWCLILIVRNHTVGEFIGTPNLVWIGIAILVGATIVVGAGNYFPAR